ncbi:hypothetical protein VP1G_11289 [Cytospora mali]|uniref:Uncharacterized protein n=1 Tax=Cytospora mali TaxID=578113 RepID=A0A194VCN6_CYTMA|nr:hypothetical protein VP1G_11289 [Valsa mali var. pyri (nom. inval.)]
MTQCTAKVTVNDGQGAMDRGGVGDEKPLNLDEVVDPQLYRDYGDDTSSGETIMDDDVSCLSSSFTKRRPLYA